LLTTEERQAWEQYRSDKLLKGGDNSQLARFFARLGELAEEKDLDSNTLFLLEELQLYGQSIIPVQET
jgi:exodeoxyribonuclease-1